MYCIELFLIKWYFVRLVYDRSQFWKKVVWSKTKAENWYPYTNLSMSLHLVFLYDSIKVMLLKSEGVYSLL